MKSTKKTPAVAHDPIRTVENWRSSGRRSVDSSLMVLTFSESDVLLVRISLWHTASLVRQTPRLGLQVVGTFSVGQRSFMVGGVYVKLGSELDCKRMADLSSQTRVIAITRPGQPVLLPPSARCQAPRYGHRLPRRAVPGAAGHSGQGAEC